MRFILKVHLFLFFACLLLLAGGLVLQAAGFYSTPFLDRMLSLFSQAFLWSCAAAYLAAWVALFRRRDQTGLNAFWHGISFGPFLPHLLYLEAVDYVKRPRPEKCAASGYIRPALILAAVGMLLLGAFLTGMTYAPGLLEPQNLAAVFPVPFLLDFMVFLLPPVCIFLYAWAVYVLVDVFPDIDGLSRAILLLWATLLAPLFPFLMFLAFTNRGRPRRRPTPAAV